MLMHESVLIRYPRDVSCIFQTHYCCSPPANMYFCSNLRLIFWLSIYWCMGWNVVDVGKQSCLWSVFSANIWLRQRLRKSEEYNLMVHYPVAFASLIMC